MTNESLLTNDDMQSINDRIVTLTERINRHFDGVEEYDSKTFRKYYFLYIEDVDDIERAITQIALFTSKLDGYDDNKTWIDNGKIIDRTIDYRDYNRWINDLDLLEQVTDYSNMWNLKTQNYNWGEEIMEWSEA